MSQSTVIVGAVVLAFLMFITVKGELPEYIGLFTLQRGKTYLRKEQASFDPGNALALGDELLGLWDGYASSGGTSNDAYSSQQEI